MRLWLFTSICRSYHNWPWRKRWRMQVLPECNAVGHRFKKQIDVCWRTSIREEVTLFVLLKSYVVRYFLAIFFSRFSLPAMRSGKIHIRYISLWSTAHLFQTGSTGFKAWKILVNQVWPPSLENTDFLLDSFVVSDETRALTVETGLTGWTARIGFNGGSTLWDLAGFSVLLSETIREPLAVRIVSAAVGSTDAREDGSLSPRRLKTELSFWKTENSFSGTTKSMKIFSTRKRLPFILKNLTTAKQVV